MDLKYTKEYIVEEMSAAPILDNTERCGIAADHREMCRFESSTSQGFRTAVAALRRYCQEAPQVISRRLNRTVEVLSENRRYEAMEIMRGIQPGPVNVLQSETVQKLRQTIHREIQDCKRH